MERVLISGGGTGIGRAIAQELAQSGKSLILLGRRRQPLEETVLSLKDHDQHVWATCDITDPQAIRKTLADLLGEQGRLQGVVANAGIGGENIYGDDDRFDEIVQTNLYGTYYLVNEAHPYLKKSTAPWRQVVVISSILARLGVPGYSAYCASKGALLSLVRSWASAWAADKILVNALCPGWVETEMAQQGIQGFADLENISYEEAYQTQMNMVLLGKMSQPDEIGQMVNFLMSDAQSSITGQAFDINNGALMPS